MIKQTAQVTTRTLTNRLFMTSSFERFKERYAGAMCAPAFSAYIGELCRIRGETRACVIQRAALDRVYGHQIFCGLRNPTRDKVIQLGFGFAMEADEMQELLKIARKCALYPRIERDAAILFCLNRHMNFVDTQQLLAELRLPILGKEQSRT